jgi:zinc/manganese transport system ATP-binding protein
LTDTLAPLIKANDLAAGYDNNVVWSNANFSIQKGEFVAVIGPNGGGKTTLFRLLLGLQPPIRGTIEILGDAPRRGNARIGYVPQRHTVDSETSIESLELVRLGLSGNHWGFGLFSKNDFKVAREAMKAVGAEEMAHRSLGTLSGGELQRVFLAEALVGKPDILLLDEPLSNLDIRREKELLSLVNKVVRSQNVTVLLIAHNINPLLPFLDRVIYVANGKIANGKPNEVLTSKSLSELYGVQIEVLRDSRGNLAIIGVEDHHPDQ